MQTITIKINRRSFQIIGLLVLGIFLLAMAYRLRSIFNPVLIALLLAYVLNPLVNLLERKKIPRTVTIFSIYVLLTTLIVIIFVVMVPLIGAEVDSLYRKALYGEGDKPSYLKTFLKTAKVGINKWNKRYPSQKIDVLIPKEELSEKIVKISSSTLETLLKTIVSLFSLLSYLILLPLYTFFLLKGLNDIWFTVESCIPENSKDWVLSIVHRMHRAVSSFFRGKLIICLIKGLATWGALEVLDVKFALLFGGIQFAASIIPFLVLLVGMVPNIALTLLDIGPHTPTLLAIVIIYGFIEALEGFVLTPWIMGKETGMHPLTVILSLLIGGKLLGLLGLLLAIPLANTLKILGEELILPHLREVIAGVGPVNPPPVVEQEQA